MTQFVFPIVVGYILQPLSVLTAWLFCQHARSQDSRFGRSISAYNV